MTNLVPTREHTELASSVRSLLDRRSDSQAVRTAMSSSDGFDRELWATLCDQVGAAALAIPEEHGGAGFTLAETYVVLEELGRALTPSPLLASVISSAALSEGALLERIASGVVATLAWSGITGPADAPVDVTFQDGTLTGTVSPVLNGDTAEILLVVAKHGDGVGLFCVDPSESGLSRMRIGGLDPTFGFASIELDAVPAEPITLDATELLNATHRVGALAVTALQVGCAQRGLDMTVDYTKQREQFGRPIGSFQALKHRMADMLVRTQMSRAGAWAAVQAHVHGSPDFDRMAAAASSYCSEAALAVAAETAQLHGGIAITWEHDAHLVLKRAQALNQLFGQPHQQRQSLIL
ncbi:acyl-CoA dehydrogenase family protein [Aeromicrobium sp. NPDC092404]|uniref:acyl-CoA dehydrogenase family protein n=1 Tax=Aeromicrobium sp. NPDC092404 TaxID=3154976 RepID=UPI003432ED49